MKAKYQLQETKNKFVIYSQPRQCVPPNTSIEPMEDCEPPVKNGRSRGTFLCRVRLSVKKKVKICHYYYVLLALRDSLYRDVAKLFQAVSGASGGRCGYKHEVSGMAQRANGHLLTMSLNMVKCCCNVEQQNLKVL